MDFVAAYNEKQALGLMFGKLMDGVEKTFRWPQVQLRDVAFVQRYQARDIMKLRFNVFKNMVFEVDVTELIYSKAISAPGEKYEIVGQQAGLLMQNLCYEIVPDNVELGEN